MAARGRPLGRHAIELLTQGMNATQAGAAALLMLWREQGNLVPFDDLDACCDIARAKTTDERAAVELVIHRLFTPQGFTQGNYRDESVTQKRDAQGIYRDASVTHQRDALDKVSGDTQRDAGGLARVRQIQAAERQGLMRLKKLQLRNALTSVGAYSDSRMGVRQLECLCETYGIDILKEYKQILAKTISVTQKPRARVCVVFNTNTNTKTNTHSDRGSSDVERGGASHPSRAKGYRSECSLTSTVEHAAAMRTAGLTDVLDAHPLLVALVAEGATVTELELAAQQASARHRGFAYALGIARNRRSDLAAAQAAPASTNPATTLLGPPEPHDATPVPAELRARLEALLHPRKNLPSTSVENPSQTPEGCSSLDESRT